MPVVRAIYSSGRTGKPVPSLRNKIDLIFVRVPPESPGKFGRFEIFDGSQLLPVYRYLNEHPRPDLVDLDRRMAWLGTGPYGDRAGDIIVLPRFGINLPINQRYYFGPQYHSEHGSPTEQDSHIPFVIAHPLKSGATLTTMTRAITQPHPSQLDLAPLVRSLLAQGTQDTHNRVSH